MLAQQAADRATEVLSWRECIPVAIFESGVEGVQYSAGLEDNGEWRMIIVCMSAPPRHERAPPRHERTSPFLLRWVRLWPLQGTSQNQEVS